MGARIAPRHPLGDGRKLAELDPLHTNTLVTASSDVNHGLPVVTPRARRRTIAKRSRNLRTMVHRSRRPRMERVSMAEPARMHTHAAPPIARTRLIGREPERASARTFLLDEAVPLLTLTGPGGVGKTRLSLSIATDVADSFADGVVWVDLAPLTDPALVPVTVARALGIVPSPGAAAESEVVRQLRPLQTLLLLDNCEHLLPAVATFVSHLLDACPAAQVLATSRAPLHVQGETALASCRLRSRRQTRRSMPLLHRRRSPCSPSVPGRSGPDSRWSCQTSPTLPKFAVVSTASLWPSSSPPRAPPSSRHRRCWHC